MEIKELQVMKGPNYYSAAHHCLIVLKLEIENNEKKNTEALLKYISDTFPEIKNCDNIEVAVQQIALKLQNRAGMNCNYGKTIKASSENIYNIIFSYEEEKAGIYAAEAAVRIISAVLKGEEYNIDEDIQELTYIKEDEAFGPSTAAIIEEAVKRGIPYSRLNGSSLIQFGYGVNQKRIRATIASTTSNIGVDIACNKDETKNILKAAMVPVPDGKIIFNEKDVERTVNELGFPLVAKPVDGNHGRGATINITSLEQAIEAFKTAQKISKGVIIEKYIVGFDFRLLVINYKLVAAAKRTPAFVKGNGAFTIQELIDEVNSDPKRCAGHANVLTRIEVDEMTLNILKNKDLTLQSVLPFGEILYLKDTANLSTGGTAADVTDQVHPYNVFLAERIAKTVGLDICGIDIMAPDLSTPVNKNGGAVLEVNAAPGFRMHTCPSEGLSRNVAEPVMDMLYPQGASATIPIIAVTGTNGKTTTTRLIAHMAKTAGHRVGFTSSDGIYIQNKLMLEGDCTGPLSADMVLKDATIDFAVMECARGGILKAGLAFSKCDVAVVTNVTEDHLGLKDINTIEEMARVKAVLPMSVSNEGYAVLNADDDLVYKMSSTIKCRFALFSLKDNNPRVAEHCAHGGIAAIIEEGYITICNGNFKKRIAKITDVPLTYSGHATGMIQNVLGAVIAGYVRNFKIEEIKLALKTFVPSEKLTPGRMNLFRFRNFNLMVDYAHNTGGYEALAQFLSKTNAEHKTGILGGVGDRRDIDIINTGIWAAKNFDEIIIRNDKDLRGRTIEETNRLIIEGIQKVKYDAAITVIPDETEAIRYAVANAKPGAFITVCCDQINDVIDLVKELKEEEDQKHPLTVKPVFVNPNEVNHLKKVS